MLYRSAIVCRCSLRSLASTATTPKLTDILIVGGGPAGLTLASALKSTPSLQHLSTTLVDASDLMGKVAPFYDSPPDNFTNRVVSLTPPSKKFLETRAGVRMLENRIQPYDGMHVTDGCSNSTLDMEKDSMAFMVEILNIQSSLLKRLEEMQLPADSFRLLDNTKVASIEYSDPKDNDSWPLVTLENGEVYKVRLLVGADGFNSPVRKFSNIESRGWFYNKFGVVATMKLEYPPYKIRGWQKFLPTGPIAHLALPDNNATLVWSTTEPLSRLLREITPEQFTGLVNAAFVLEDSDMKHYYSQLEKGKISTEELLEDIRFRTEQVYDALENEDLIDEIYPPRVKEVLGPSRARFPLKMFHADTYCVNRIALVGDAAHTTHPLAGQGLNMGQGDVEALVNALEKATKRGLDIGSLLTLQPFWAERYPINNMLLGMTDKLHKIYSTDFGPIVALRSLGVDAINRITPVKNLITGILSDSVRRHTEEKTMSVLLETTAGDIVIDLNVIKYEIESYNFLKLCKCRFYQNQCFYNLRNDRSIQFGDALLGYEDRKELRVHNTAVQGIAKEPSGMVEARLARATNWPELLPKIPKGSFGNLLVQKSGINAPLIGSQMLVSLNEFSTTHPDTIYFGKVIENCWSTLDKINTYVVDTKLRPQEDIRIRAAYIIHDPFPDKADLHTYQVSLPMLDIRLPQGLADGFQTNDQCIQKDIRRKELSLEIIGDIPFIGIKPSARVLFICKLNPLTKAKDLATIFQRFGPVMSVEVVRDKSTGRSLGYGFIEFTEKVFCEQAYKKMEGIIIDDKRIHVDFSQSVRVAARSLRN